MYSPVKPNQIRSNPVKPLAFTHTHTSHDRGGVERLAFSVLWEMNSDAEILSTRFTKSVIRSSAALTYQQVRGASLLSM